MIRICPFCKAKLGLHDRYFCTSCGNNLPAELIESASHQNKIIKHESKNTPKLSIKPSITVRIPKPSRNFIEKIGTVFLSAGFSALIALITYTFLAPRIIYKDSIPYIQSGSTKQSGVMTTNKNVQNIVGQNKDVSATSQKVINPICSFSSGNILDPNLAKHIPYTADLYMESFDSKSFLKDIIDSDIVSDTKFVNFYNTQKENFMGTLGFFVIKNPTDYTYGIVLSLKDSSNKTEIEKNNNIIFFDNYIVMTTKIEIIEDLMEVSKGTEKSLVLNPVYASAKSVLPKEGKLLILPLTRNGNGFLYQLLDKKLTDQMFSIINNFLDSKLDYAVVL